MKGRTRVILGMGTGPVSGTLAGEYRNVTKTTMTETSEETVAGVAANVGLEQK